MIMNRIKCLRNCKQLCAPEIAGYFLCESVAKLGCLPPGADLKFVAPRNFCLIPQNFLTTFFWTFSIFRSSTDLRLFCKPFLKFSPQILPPPKILLLFEIFRYIVNFAAPQEVPPGWTAPIAPPPCYATDLNRIY